MDEPPSLPPPEKADFLALLARLEQNAQDMADVANSVHGDSIQTWDEALLRAARGSEAVRKYLEVVPDGVAPDGFYDKVVAGGTGTLEVGSGESLRVYADNWDADVLREIADFLLEFPRILATPGEHAAGAEVGEWLRDSAADMERP